MTFLNMSVQRTRTRKFIFQFDRFHIRHKSRVHNRKSAFEKHKGSKYRRVGVSNYDYMKNKNAV